MDSNSEIDLSPLIAHNLGTLPFHISPPTSPTIISPLRIQQRPISRRRGKKRSSRACASCRARKVRCNIVPHGAPCSNCRHDEVHCVLPLSRRQRAARERAEQHQQQSQNIQDSIYGSDAGDGCTQNQERESDSWKQHSEGIEREEPTPILAPHGMPISFHPLAEILPTNSISQCQSPSLHPISPSHHSTSRIQIYSPLVTAPLPASLSNPHHLPILPRIFAPFPSHLSPTDLSYLHHLDALTLPSEELQIALLKGYIEFIYPTLPILDLEEFLESVRFGEGLGKKRCLNFLLFQAVMFAGVEIVTLKALRKEGYGSRETAKRMLFRRVRLLYDFDTTTDRQAIIQSLLLMTLYNPLLSLGNEHKDAHHYLGLAISLSFSIGINRDLPVLPAQSNLRRKRTERRIWWSTFVRERVLAMEGCEKRRSGRKVRIRKEDSDVDILSLEDFELYDGGEDEMEVMKDKRNAEAFVEKVKLCWWGGEVVSRFAPPRMVYQRPQIRISEATFNQHIEQQQQLYAETSAQDKPIPKTREEADYNLNSKSVSSLSTQDCLTPQNLTDSRDNDEKVRFGSPLGAEFTVDGEYDDYVEYLKGSVESDLEVRGRGGEPGN